MGAAQHATASSEEPSLTLLRRDILPWGNLRRIEAPDDSPEFVEVLHNLAAMGEEARGVDLVA